MCVELVAEGVLCRDADGGVAACPALVLGVAPEVAVDVLDVRVPASLAQVEFPGAFLVAVLDMLCVHGVVAVGYPHVPVDDACEVDLVAHEGIRRNLDNLETLLDDVRSDEAFFGVGEDRRVTAIGALRHTDEVAQRTRVVLVFGAVVECLALFAVERSVVNRLQHLDGGWLVEVQVHGIERLVTVIVDGYNEDGLVPEGIHVILDIGDGNREAVGTFDPFCLPDLCGVLARSVEVHLEFFDGATGVNGADIEGGGLLVACPYGIARNVKQGRRIDNTDVERTAVHACGVYSVVAVNGTEDGEVHACTIEGPALYLGVFARDDGVAKNPFEAVDLFGIERQEPHEVYGVVHGDGNGIGDGVGGHVGMPDGIREGFGVIEGVGEREDYGMVVPEPGVFHDGGFP